MWLYQFYNMTFSTEKQGHHNYDLNIFSYNMSHKQEFFFLLQSFGVTMNASHQETFK